MPSFFHNIADKAQSALNATPIGAHIPQLSHTAPPPTADHNHNQPPPPTQGPRSHALEAMGHQFRVLQQQYGAPATSLQRLITSEKSVVIDYDALARDIKIQSKELFTFGQAEAEDVKDVTDRVAYLNFVHGTLTDALAVKLEVSRTTLKSIRDAEAALLPKRNIRAGIQLQIQKIQSDGQKGAAVERRLAELQDSLRKAQAEDEELERQLEISKRKFLRESEAAKWAALREYGEKIVLLSQASSYFLEVLPSIPPTPQMAYTGAAKTATVRDALQRTLDNWSPGYIKLPPLPERENSAETRSFGETHATELSNITSHPVAAPLSSSPPHTATAPSAPNTTKPIDPTTLNQSPITLPAQPPISVTPIGAVVTDLPPPTNPAPSATPTVAETGVPISAGAAGPGPKTGSLADRAPSGAAVAIASLESAEDEKKRLEREERERVLRLAASPPLYDHAPSAPADPRHESAEEEKKRLEREERERVLAAGGSGPGAGPSGEHSSDVPPPY